MLEFDDFVYLDVQKTGSTTIRQFLMACGRGTIIADDKHAPVRRREPGKRYFISCRDPMAQYVSLYAYGYGLTPNGRPRRNRGAIHAYLARSGRADVYDGTPEGFCAWMVMMLDPAFGQAVFGGRDSHPLLEVIGLQSLRFVTLNLAAPERALASARSEEDVIETLRCEGLAHVVLRTETLSEQLHLMCDGVYGEVVADRDAAHRYLETQSVKNESFDLGLRPETLPADLRRRVQVRERLFFDLLNYAPYVSGDGDV